MKSKTRNGTTRAKSTAHALAKAATLDANPPGYRDWLKQQVPPRLPAPETLALIAATVNGRAGMESDAAVDYAYQLWDASCRRIDREIYDHEHNLHDAREIFSGNLVLPPSNFPAPLDQFLKEVIQTTHMSLDGARKRFREFLSDRIGQGQRNEIETERHLIAFQKGIDCSEEWNDLREGYLRWWVSKLSEIRRAEGKKSHPET